MFEDQVFPVEKRDLKQINCDNAQRHGTHVTPHSSHDGAQDITLQELLDVAEDLLEDGEKEKAKGKLERYYQLAKGAGTSYGDEEYKRLKAMV